jgi:ribosomal protein S15P/S13E
MAKIETLRGKFPQITEQTFIRLFEGDKTSTKKYAEFLLSAWNRKGTNYGGLRGVDDYIKLVENFEKLTHYIDNKDIYSYGDIQSIVGVVKIAEAEKNEKSFDKDENISIIEETEDYIFLIPKTHIGSLKYGSNTKWCTSSSTSPGTFKNYTDRGFLAYLIDKKNKKTNNQNKLAFYFTNKENLLTQVIQIFNQLDSTVNENQVIQSGWDIMLLSKLITKLRTHLFEYKEQEKVRVEVSKTMAKLNEIRYDDFFNALNTLRVNPENIEELRSALGLVKTSMKKIKV